MVCMNESTGLYSAPGQDGSKRRDPTHKGIIGGIATFSILVAAVIISALRSFRLCAGN